MCTTYICEFYAQITHNSIEWLIKRVPCLGPMDVSGYNSDDDLNVICVKCIVF